MVLHGSVQVEKAHSPSPASGFKGAIAFDLHEVSGMVSEGAGTPFLTSDQSTIRLAGAARARCPRAPMARGLQRESASVSLAKMRVVHPHILRNAPSGAQLAERV